MQEETSYLGIVIDESRTDSLPDYSQYLVLNHYARKDESIQQAFARASKCWSSNPEHAQRLYNYCSEGWFMYASPTFSNSILPGEKPKSMPISCFLPLIEDDIPSLIFGRAEFALLSVMGGGIGQDWSSVRPVSAKAPGPIPFIHENDGGVLAWKQGKTRRGALAAYMSVGHPDTVEFLKIRTPTGDSDRKSLNIHHGYNIDDKFMQAMERGDSAYPLINPSNGEQEGEINPREHFVETIKIRGRTGEPYMYFIDTANRFLPTPQKYLGLRSHASNLCTEITLPASRTRTPVCCLSSINAEMYPKFKPVMKQFISDLIEMLDNVIEFFITNIDNIASNYESEFDQNFIKMILSKVKNSASKERSLGLGLMGWHYLLQSKGIPFESQEADDLNEEIFKSMKFHANEASNRLGVERGIAPDIQEYIDKCKENGDIPDPYWTSRRNLHLLAIAPNANNSVILHTSAGIETELANLYSREMRIGMFTIKNRHLEELLDSKGENTVEVWDSIADNGGSVQHLDCLTLREKRTFKCAMEIDQEWVIRQAATRQPYVCQAQSINLYLGPGSDINKVVQVHYLAWKNGVKSLYYYRTETDAKVERVSKEIEEDKVEEDRKTIVYGTPTCGQCAAVKALLSAKGFEYEYIDLIAIGKTAAEVTGRPVRSVPQVYIDGEYIGGLNEVIAYLNQTVETEKEADCENCSG